MSTPERPLTRRQLKEMRRTGQLPVITPEEAAEAAEGAAAPAEKAPPGPEPTPDAAAEGADTPQEGRPEETGDAAAPESSRPLTRKELRAQRLRTNQITAISDEDADGLDDAKPDADMAPQRAARLAVGFDGTGITEGDDSEEPAAEDAAPAEERRDDETASAKVPPQGEGTADEPGAQEEAAPVASEPARAEGGTPQVGASFGAAVFRQADERQRAERERAEREAAARREAKAQQPGVDEAPASAAPEPAAKTDTGELAADAFQRAAHSGGSTSSSTSSLILKDMPGTAALSAPITATGELILTSSHTLPAGLGAHGAAHGTTDGKELDDALIDGEIPQHSSPTPIAASSAVSTSKAPGEVIRPPAPEKNRGLMLGLGITAGVLGLALIGVVVYVFATGALN